MSLPLREKALLSTLNGFGKKKNLNCFFITSHKNKRKSNNNLKAMTGQNSLDRLLKQCLL
jgi:hypothetical protein